MINQKTPEREIFQWHGAAVTNIETEAEKSAVGLAGTGGILILALPENPVMSDLRVGDVILNYNGITLSGFNSLVKLEEGEKPKESMIFVIQRNQTQQTVILNLK